MKVNLFFLTVFSVLAAALAGGPDDALSVVNNKKCPNDGNRMVNYNTNPSQKDEDLCYQECLDAPGCTHISVGSASGKWYCMGCSDANGFSDHGGFKLYEVDTSARVVEPEPEAEPAWEIPADAPYKEIILDQKCPNDSTRLFRTVHDELQDIETCYAQCKSIQNCKHISYGLWQGDYICMGCNGHEYGYEHHGGFTVYEIDHRDDWEFTKVGAKKTCASQSYQTVPDQTQEECHALCLNTQGCGYFSMTDMAFDPIGSGTCNLCKYADGFSSSGNSNTYSVLNPADYRPVCEGKTGVVWGDPHFITFDKLKYDCQGRGEFVLVKSNGDDPLAIHGVFEDTGGSATGPSVTRSLAILVDEQVPVLQITIPDMPDANGKCDFSYTLGENEIPIPADEIVDYFANNYPGEANVYTNEKAVIVTFPDYQTRIEILTHSGHFTRFGCRMRASVCVTASNHGGEGNIVGLFGSPTGSKTDDWMKNDGVGTGIALPSNPRREGTGYCRENWCVSREDSLYGDSTYTDHNKCAEDNFDPDAYYDGIENLPEEVKTACEATENPDECMSDVVVLKDLLEEDGEDVDLEDLLNAVDGITEEEEDAAKVSDTTEAELYSEEDWSSPDVNTLNTQSTVSGSLNNGLVSEIIPQVDEESNDPNCPVCKSRGWGDPHIITFDGVTYDVHVKGELTFLKSLQTDFTIQARTEIVANHPKGPAVTTAVVVHEDSTKNLPVVQVSLARPVNGPSVQIGGCPTQLFVDGAYRDITTGTGSVDATVQVKGKRILLEYPSTNLKLDIQVRSWRNTCHFSVNYILADCRCDETLVGILGQPGDGPLDDWHLHNGTAVPIPSRRDRRGKKAYDYATTWCLENATVSHFTYEGGNNFDTFDFCNPEQYDDTLDKIIDDASDEVKEKCTIDGELDHACIIEDEYFGDEAVEEYKELIQNTETADIPDPPEPPTSGPTSGPTSAPTKVNTLDDVPDNGDENDEPEDTDPTEPADIPNPDGSTSGSNGDPHFKTWRNEHFEYHSQCDLVLAADSKFADGLGLDVQIRTKLVRFWSYIKNAAIRIGNDILEIQGTGEDVNELIYWYNLQYHGEMETIGGFPINVIKGTGRFNKNKYTIDLSSKYPGQKIVISTWKEFVRVDFVDASFEAFGNAVGMLGEFKTGNTLARDGSVMHDFHQFGDEWQVRPTDNMLFHDVEQPQFPRKCIMPEDPQGQRRRQLGESSVTEEQAEKACASLTDPLDRKDCIYDIIATQDMDMAGAY